VSIRTLKKEEAKEKFNYQIKKERAIGVDPIYSHRLFTKYYNPYEVSKEWKKKSEEYERTQVS
jgi:hypothetical protein